MHSCHMLGGPGALALTHTIYGTRRSHGVTTFPLTLSFQLIKNH